MPVPNDHQKTMQFSGISAAVPDMLAKRLAYLESPGRKLPGFPFALNAPQVTIGRSADADICVLDPAKKVTVSAKDTHYATDYDVYEGFECTGWPVITISRGEVIVENGKFLGHPGRGEFLRRNTRS